MEDIDIQQIIDRIEKLENSVFGSISKKKSQKKSHSIGPNNIDFSPNVRAFVKRYASGKSGPKKFTMLLAYLTKGKIDQPIPLSQIINHWNKMTSKSLLGKFNMFYPNEAKTQGWVNSAKYGHYSLSSEWTKVL